VIASRDEIRAAMAGVLRLWRGDTSGFLAFDRSLAGFWRSYTAAILGAPIHALLLIFGRAEGMGGPFETMRSGITEVLAYSIGWLAYPLLMARLTERIGRGERFFDYMVAYNWSALAQLVLFTGAAMLKLVLPGFLGSVAILVALAAVLHLQWFIAKEGLAVPGRTAFLVVVADLSLSFLIGGVTDYLRS